MNLVSNHYRLHFQKYIKKKKCKLQYMFIIFLCAFYSILGRTEVIGIRGTANMNTVEHLSNNSPNQSSM